jgi:abortive infection bacteriophage resistance protein
MRKYCKPAIPIKDQIDKLEKRGLKFKYITDAEKILSNISYYRLRAYTYPFQDNINPDHPFKQEITFEEIIKLYEFDSKLRLIIFEATEYIEVALRTQIVYQMSIKNGSHWHTNPVFYRDSLGFANHLTSLQGEIDRSKEDFISHYQKNYNDPPFPPAWMSLEVVSMGLLSKMFKNLKFGEEKKAILSHFGLKKIDILENWMLCFSTLRNICAHHSRVWNRRLTQINVPNDTIDIFLKNKNPQPNKLYMTLSCMVYMLKCINPKCNFVESIKELVSSFDGHSKILKDMGFPPDWEEEKLWN